MSVQELRRLVDDDRCDPQTLGTILACSTVIALAVIRCGRIIFANPAFLSLFRARGTLIGCLLTDIVRDAGDETLQTALAAAEHAPVRHFGIGWRGDGQLFDLELHLESAVFAGTNTIIAFASDITDQRRSRQQLAYLAYSDTLTGLANRALFADRLHEAMLRARQHGTVFAVLMVDLDGFKTVNDTCGHDAGDVVLQLVGQRFQGCIREGDTLARIGGDEFAILLPQLTDQRTASLVAQRLIDALSAPLDFGQRPCVVGASIGIAAWPEHAGSVDALLAAADTAMYCAKRSGKNQFQWAAGQLDTEIVSLPALSWSAAHAIGIKEIDDQHMHLAELIDRLSVALKEGQDRETIATGLDHLIHYATVHFATEERLMELHQVAGRQRHREEHRRLLHEICDLQVGGEPNSISLILRYLQEWLLRHVDGLDRQLAQALIARGCG